MATRPGEGQSEKPAGEGHKHQVKIGEPECPRCKKSFTMSYWRGDQLVQARCLSCDLKWPRPDVV
jgi:Zn ribbon nucleic-acid-binding protein